MAVGLVLLLLRASLATALLNGISDGDSLETTFRSEELSLPAQRNEGANRPSQAERFPARFPSWQPSERTAQATESSISVALSAVPSTDDHDSYGDLSWPEKLANERWHWLASGHRNAGRNLLMTTSVVQEDLAAFQNFGGVVKLDIYTKNPPTVCTAALVAPTVLLTAPACFTEAEAPPTLASNYEGSSVALSPYPVIAGNGQVIGHTNFHYYVYNTGQEGYRLSIVNMTRRASSFRFNPVTGLTESIVPYYGIVTQDLEPPLAAVSGGYGPNNLTTVNNDIVPLGVGIQRMANVTLTGRGQSVKRIGKCSGARIGGNLYTDRIARLRDTYVRMCGRFGDMGAPLLFDAGNSTYFVGGTLIDVDVYPCATNKATYTSVPFRQEWIKDKMQRLQTVVTFPVEQCPTASMTGTVTGTQTGTMTPSSSMIINVTIVIPPPEIPFPWWWVATIASGILGLLIILFGIFWYVRRTMRIMRAAEGYDKTYFSRPHKDQIAPPPEFKSLQKDKLFKATAADLGGLKSDEDPAAVADEIFEDAAAGSSAAGGHLGYKQKLTSDEFMKRLQKRIARKTARVAPGGSIASSSESGAGLPSKNKILEARDRNADFAATTRSLRPRFNPSATVGGSATINAEIPDMLMLGTPAVFMPLSPPNHPVGSGSSALGAKVAAARSAAAGGQGGVPVLLGPTGVPIPFVPVLPIPQHPHLNGAGVPLSVSIASPGGTVSGGIASPLATGSAAMMPQSLLISATPSAPAASPFLIPHYGHAQAGASPPPILGFGSSYVATAAMAGLSPRSAGGALPISIAVSTGAPLSPTGFGGNFNPRSAALSPSSSPRR